MLERSEDVAGVELLVISTPTENPAISAKMRGVVATNRTCVYSGLPCQWMNFTFHRRPRFSSSMLSWPRDRFDRPFSSVLIS